MNTRQVSGGWSSATRAGRAGNQQLTSAAPGRRKNTPMRGAENLTLVLVLLACAWTEQGRTQAPDVKSPAPRGNAEALSARYHFLETYTATEDPAKPELLSQYEVGCIETVKVTREKPQGAPEHDETVLQTIYTERVAKVSKEVLVTEVVRRYDKSNFRTTVDVRPFKTKWLDGLTILYRLQNRMMPQVQSLSSRMLRQQEYEMISQQSFLPVLATIFPRQPSRQGDTWSVPRGAAWALLGVPPSEEDYGLVAEILEIRKNEPGSSMTAVISVKGPCVVPQGPSAINAQVHFTFEPSEAVTPAREHPDAGGEPAKDQPSTKPAVPDRRTQAVIDARGYINKVSMAQEVTTPLTGNDGRFKQLVRREVVLERRKSAGAATLEIPNPLPAPKEENTWLVYDEPQGRFHFLHPQELRPVKVYPEGGVDLLDRRPDGPDVIQLNLVPKSQDPQKDRLAADPIQEKKQLEDDWKKRGVKVVTGAAGWLPDADWAPSKRKVYRIEASLIKEDDGTSPSGDRIYLDRYLVQFTRSEVMKVTAMTSRDGLDHLNFRKRAENVIKTFDFGPSEGFLPASPTPARPAR